ncbi:MAG TPA: protein phosphatase 2C domain-containing protein [Longimicrobiaceae bacterium]|nr:protein phosphatase 2C domain-containing protein [Longimicrobiaceae bacterium]
MSATVRTLHFEVAGFSEQGPRPENQDAYSTESFEKLGLIALADGMGGEKSGRIAADTALDALRARAPIRNVDEARRAMREADRLVSQRAETDPDHLGGMGCALGLLALTNGGDGPGWIAAHVGDVRILSRSPDGVVRLETRDHTPAFARWEAGEITLDEIPDSTGANRLQRAVGRNAEADVAWLPAGPGWSWLLMSDGIYKAMRLDELAAAMSAPAPAEACEAIRAKVQERGPDDNFTAVIVRAAGGPGVAASTPTTATSEPMSTPVQPRGGRSAAAMIAIVLALAALGLGGFALFTAREAAEAAVEREDLQRLRSEVDSLRAVLAEFVEPFGPTAPEPGALTPQIPPAQ